MQGVSSKDAFEREDEHLADVEDRRHEPVRFSSVEQEQDDPKPDDELDEPEDEDDDPEIPRLVSGSSADGQQALTSRGSGPSGAAITGRERRALEAP